MNKLEKVQNHGQNERAQQRKLCIYEYKIR